MSQLRYWWERLKTNRFFQPKNILADCGHLTKAVDVLTVFGYGCTTRLPIIGGHTAYCHACLAKMVIRCAWCGQPIFVGDPVTLYTPGQNFVLPEYAQIYRRDPLQIVGCLRWNCAATGADRAGFWVPPGQVKRVQSPLERAIAADGIVIIEDLARNESS